MTRLHGLLLGLVGICTGATGPVAAQQLVAWTDSLLTLPMDQVVVTATRGLKALRDVPVPTQVIGPAEIEAQGAMRLSDLLAEQAGLTLVEDHGAGIQVQGLSSDYTLILIDGEPVIGRAAGTLDLERLTVAGLERIEVVRGPSSSLYGSEALAGVINLITRKPDQRFQGRTRMRYETHNTVDVVLETEGRRGPVGGRMLLNRFSTDGYDLAPHVTGPTIPGFTDYAAEGQIYYAPNDRTTWTLAGHWADQDQRSPIEIETAGIPTRYEQVETRTDWRIAPRVDHTFSDLYKLTGRLYGARYTTNLALFTQADGSRFSQSPFDQGYGKGELQFDAVLNAHHLLTAGTGYIAESVSAARVAGGRRTTNAAFGFGQHEWFLHTRWDLLTSARLDVHSDYGARLSPKVAVLYKPNASVRVRGAVGTGFKAPTFQQRYMDFTNPIAGYTVIGATDVAGVLQTLEAQGQVQAVLTDVAALGEIRPEHGVSFNVGLTVRRGSWLDLEVNLFRNHVRDLIETAPVALKTNGQSVFTYFNLNRIYTQGIETQATWTPSATIALSASYQYLDARDRDVLDAIAEGTLYTRVDGRDRRLTKEGYGGLFNRSRHSGTLRLTYRNPALGLLASVRGQLRGRYGFGDRNGNLVLDTDAEYVPGYALWHMTLTQNLGRSVKLQAGVRNLFGATNPVQVPSLSGRLLFAGLHVTL